MYLFLFCLITVSEYFVLQILCMILERSVNPDILNRYKQVMRVIEILFLGMLIFYISFLYLSDCFVVGGFEWLRPHLC